MKAKKMFKELGYTHSLNQDKTVIEYQRKCRMWREEGFLNINFDKERYCMDTDFKGEISGSLPVFLNIKELESITQQCKELGWLDE